MDVDGSLFQAFFNTRAAALAAFVAASGHSVEESCLLAAAEAANEAWLDEERLKKPGGSDLQ